MKITKNAPILFLGIVIEVLFVFVLNLQDFKKETPFSFLYLYFSIFLIYLIALKLKSNKSIWLILIFAFLFRCTMLFSPSGLSGDIYRYYWDGRVTNHGINPFSYPPNSEEIAYLQDSNYERINNKHVSTIYPPFSQLIFAITYFIKPEIFAFKTIFMTFDFLSIFLLMFILKNNKVSLDNLLVYAWNPLVVVEFASSGHNDSLAIFLILLSYCALLKNKNLSCSIILSFAVLTKFYAVLLIPFFFKRNFSQYFAFLLTILVSYLPFISIGEKLFSGLSSYLEYWLFNPSIFRVFNYFFSFEVSKFISRSILIISYLFLFSKKDILWSSYVILGICLLTAPTVHPWYVTWILPFLVFQKSYAWILFTGLVALSYTYYISQTEIQWMISLEYIPFYVLLTWEGRSYIVTFMKKHASGNIFLALYILIILILAVIYFSMPERKMFIENTLKWWGEWWDIIIKK